MTNKVKKVIEPIIGYGIVAIILISIISAIAILGGGIMRLFGFEYVSIKSIITFFLIVALVGFPMETFVTAFIKALLSLNRITNSLAKILFIILDTMSTMITMSLVDYFMKSVSVSYVSIFVISLIIACLSIEDFNG